VVSTRTEEVAPGIMLDFVQAGTLIAIEMLDGSERSVATSAAA
jgi:hypothetical protein